MKKFLVMLLVGLLVCGSAMAYNWGEADLFQMLKYAFSTTNGHDHDGVNSKKLVGVSAIAAITATDAEINMAADNSANVEVVAATNVIGAAESGKTFFLNHATEFVSTLPAPAAGLRYKFIVAGAPSGASYTVVTASSANIIIGGVSISTIDDTVDGSSDADADTVTFADGASVVGDWIEVISDGTSWFLSGHSNAVTGVVLSKAS